MSRIHSVLLGVDLCALLAAPAAYGGYIHGRDPFILLKDSIR